MWDKTEVDLGKIKPGSKRQVNFQFNGDIEVAKWPNGQYRIHTSCGCSKPNWNPITKILSVDYTAKPVPKHLVLAKVNHYNSRQHITVVDVNNEHYVLHLCANVGFFKETPPPVVIPPVVTTLVVTDLDGIIADQIYSYDDLLTIYNNGGYGLVNTPFPQNLKWTLKIAEDEQFIDNIGISFYEHGTINRLYYLDSSVVGEHSIEVPAGSYDYYLFKKPPEA